MNVPIRRRIALVLLALLPSWALTGCGSGSEGTGPTPSFDLTVGSPALTLTVGSAAVNAVSVSRFDGFEGAVTVTVEGLPQGVFAAPLTIEKGRTSAAFTLAASGTAATGTTTVTVRAVAPGAVVRTTTVDVTITLPPAFSIALPAPALAIESRFSGTATIAIGRQGGFDGAVNFISSGAPQGMSLAFTPSSSGNTSSTVSINVAPGVPVGVYPITITGSGAGVLPASVVLTVTVTPAVTPGIGIVVPTGTITVNELTGAATTVGITRVNFDGAVNLQALNAPEGMQVTFAPPAAGANSAAMSVTIQPYVTPGTYVLTVKAQAPGVPTVQGDVAVTVYALPSIVRIVTTPVNLTIARNGSGSSRLTLARTNVPGEVQFSLIGLPHDVEASFSPARTKGDTATVTLHVGNDAPPGTYPLVVHAVQASLPNLIGAAPLVLTITNGGSGDFASAVMSASPFRLTDPGFGVRSR